MNEEPKIVVKIINDQKIKKLITNALIISLWHRDKLKKQVLISHYSYIGKPL